MREGGRGSELVFFGEGLSLLFEVVSGLLEEVEARLAHAVSLLAALNLLDRGLSLSLVDQPHRPHPLQLRHLLPLLTLHCHPLGFFAILQPTLRVLTGLGPADLQGQEILLNEVGILAEAFAVEVVGRGEEGVGEVLGRFLEALLLVMGSFELIDLVTEFPPFLLEVVDDVGHAVSLELQFAVFAAQVLELAEGLLGLDLQALDLSSELCVLVLYGGDLLLSGGELGSEEGSFVGQLTFHRQFLSVQHGKYLFQTGCELFVFLRLPF